MVRELRDLWFVVYRCSAAIEMPDVIRARDELIRRFVTTALSEPEGAAAPTPDCWTSQDDDDELPLYCEASADAGQRSWTRRLAMSRDDVPTRSS